MARTHVDISAPPAAVFGVLQDPYTYGSWLVGCKGVRHLDLSWPSPGARFHHVVGFGPLAIRDSTKLVATDGSARLVLEARARPAGVAHVSFDVEPCAGGARVSLREEPQSGVAALVWGRVVDRLVLLRNTQSLRRLKRFVEAGVPASAPPLA